MLSGVDCICIVICEIEAVAGSPPATWDMNKLGRMILRFIAYLKICNDKYKFVKSRT